LNVDEEWAAGNMLVAGVLDGHGVRAGKRRPIDELIV